MWRQLGRRRARTVSKYPKRALHVKSTKAQKYQRNTQEAVMEKAPQIVSIIQAESNLFVSKTCGKPIIFCRFMEGKHLTNDKGELDLHKVRRPYDNSSRENRYSGALAGSQQKGQSALYIGTLGDYGLPGQTVVERAFYASGEAEYIPTLERATRLKSGRGREEDWQAIRRYFAPGVLLAPGFVCIQFEVTAPIYYINLSDPETQRRLEKPLEPARKELLQVYKAESESDPGFLQKLPSDLAAEVASKRPGDSMSIEAALFGSVYSVSLSLGNITLGQDCAIFYESARGGVPSCSNNSLRAH